MLEDYIFLNGYFVFPTRCDLRIYCIDFCLFHFYSCIRYYVITLQWAKDVSWNPEVVIKKGLGVQHTASITQHLSYACKSKQHRTICHELPFRNASAIRLLLTKSKNQRHFQSTFYLDVRNPCPCCEVSNSFPHQTCPVDHPSQPQNTIWIYHRMLPSDTGIPTSPLSADFLGRGGIYAFSVRGSIVIVFLYSMWGLSSQSSALRWCALRMGRVDAIHFSLKVPGYWKNL